MTAYDPQWQLTPHACPYMLARTPRRAQHSYAYRICGAHIYLRNVAKNREERGKSFEPCCWHIMPNILKRIKTYCILCTDWIYLYYNNIVIAIILVRMVNRVPRTILQYNLSALPFFVRPKAIFDPNRLFFISIVCVMQTQAKSLSFGKIIFIFGYVYYRHSPWTRSSILNIL